MSGPVFKVEIRMEGAAFDAPCGKPGEVSRILRALAVAIDQEERLEQMARDYNGNVCGSSWAEDEEEEKRRQIQHEVEDESVLYPHDEEDGITSDHLDIGAFESREATRKEEP